MARYVEIGGTKEGDEEIVGTGETMGTIRIAPCRALTRELLLAVATVRRTGAEMQQASYPTIAIS
jgi:hypothetical protein